MQSPQQYYSRGGRVAQFGSTESVFPSALHFSGEGELFPVGVFYEDDVREFAKGGLADEALSVRGAGRHGDTEIIHINKEELEELKQVWGEPTINPETGQPEFFLKKLWKGVKKVVKPIAPLLPIAAMFLPPPFNIIGSVAAGALSGGVNGGVKGALLGGAMGGLGASGAGGKLGGAILGKGASAAAQNAIGQGLISGALGAAGGQDPLKSAIMGAGQGYLTSTLNAPKTPAGGSAPPGTAPPIVDTSSGFTDANLTPSGEWNMGNVVSEVARDAGIAGTQLAAATAAPDLAVKPPNFLNKDFLGMGIAKNKYAIPAILGAAALMDGLGKKEDTSMSASDFFGPNFGDLSHLGNIGGGSTGGGSTGGGGLPAPKGHWANLGMSEGRPLESYYSEGYAPEYKYFSAKGGRVPADPPMQADSFAVKGGGSGRSDDIPAMLSDGEYVFDAEIVALLGDGSSKAGAKILDDFRVNIRKQKGRKLAKGKISQNAKAPERYMAGGRI